MGKHFLSVVSWIVELGNGKVVYICGEEDISILKDSRQRVPSPR